MKDIYIGLSKIASELSSIHEDYIYDNFFSTIARVKISAKAPTEAEKEKHVQEIFYGSPATGVMGKAPEWFAPQLNKFFRAELFKQYVALNVIPKTFSKEFKNDLINRGKVPKGFFAHDLEQNLKSTFQWDYFKTIEHALRKHGIPETNYDDVIGEILRQTFAREDRLNIIQLWEKGNSLNITKGFIDDVKDYGLSEKAVQELEKLIGEKYNSYVILAKDLLKAGVPEDEVDVIKEHAREHDSKRIKVKFPTFFSNDLFNKIYNYVRQGSDKAVKHQERLRQIHGIDFMDTPIKGKDTSTTVTYGELIPSSISVEKQVETKTFLDDLTKYIKEKADVDTQELFKDYLEFQNSEYVKTLFVKKYKLEKVNLQDKKIKSKLESLNVSPATKKLITISKVFNDVEDFNTYLVENQVSDSEIETIMKVVDLEVKTIQKREFTLIRNKLKTAIVSFLRKHGYSKMYQNFIDKFLGVSSPKEKPLEA